MNEKTMRWNARIGKMKAGCGLALFFILMLACVSAFSLNSALKNADGPQTMTVSQLVHEEVDMGMYVSVTGLAAYDMGYEETDEDDDIVATYYFMVDNRSDDMVLIKHASATLPNEKRGRVTVEGMTRPIPTDLKTLLKEDAAIFDQNGLQITTKFYINAAQTPPILESSVILLFFSVIASVLCVIPFLFPSHVFVLKPLNTKMSISREKPKLKATGTFVEIKDMDTLRIGKGTRKFNNVTANLVKSGEDGLMIYIHHIFKNMVYGFTVNTTVTDWAIFIKPDSVQSIESGVLYGWKDELAIRIMYLGSKGKLETAFIHLENVADQTKVVLVMRKMGFPVRIGKEV
jgi:hypothetical protein